MEIIQGCSTVNDDLLYHVPSQGNQSGHLSSPVGAGHMISYEDHIASQILTQFPEIGQILDNQ